VHPEAGVIGATIWHRNEPAKLRDDIFLRKADFTGCGHALRVSAYHETRGYLPRPNAYGMEETDLSIQLFAKGWKIFQTSELRVFHDTELTHHESPEITADTIANVALFAFLHYPLWGWPRGSLQVVNRVVYSLKMRRITGIFAGLRRIPRVCLNLRRYRAPLPWHVIRGFLDLRKRRAT